MMFEQTQSPVRFVSDDNVLEIVSHPPIRPTTGKSRVMVEIRPRWPTPSPSEPIAFRLASGASQPIAYSNPSGDSIDGTVQFRSTSSGSMVVFVDLEYGHEEVPYKLEGVVAWFPGVPVANSDDASVEPERLQQGHSRALHENNPTRGDAGGSRYATITVLLRSRDPRVCEVKSGEIVFELGSSTLRNRGTTDGQIELMISEPRTVVVRGVVAEASEFTETELSRSLELQPGGQQSVMLVFTPKPKPLDSPVESVDLPTNSSPQPGEPAPAVPPDPMDDEDDW